MATLIGLAVVVALMSVAYWLHGRLDGMLSKFEARVKPHVPAMKHKVSAGLEAAKGYVRPRAAGWARRMALGVVANVAVIFAAATCVALVKPAPQELNYSNVAKRENTTLLQRGLAFAAYNSGWCIDRVDPGFFFSTARLSDGTVLVGLPGLQQWYRL